MIHGIPSDIRWVIEAMVRLAGESHDSFIPYMSGSGKITYSKKQRAKQMGVCYKCSRCTCNTRCSSLRLVSNNH